MRNGVRTESKRRAARSPPPTRHCMLGSAMGPDGGDRLDAMSTFVGLNGPLWKVLTVSPSAAANAGAAEDDGGGCGLGDAWGGGGLGDRGGGGGL